MKSPYPYFGGKSRVAPVVWERFGNTPNYVEPFFGSGAMLLARPAQDLEQPRIETVNDKDGFIANFWRAVKTDPEAVAHHADWPVNENDLHARHAWLVGQRDSLTERLEGDPDFFDSKVAGWWVWGMSCWIGGGFCDGSGPWRSVDGKLINLKKDADQGVYGKRPDLHHHGSGVVSSEMVAAASKGVDPAISGKLPDLRLNKGIQTRRSENVGTYHKRPRLDGDMGIQTRRERGMGVAGQLPYLRSNQGISRQAPRLSGDQGVVRQLPELKSLRGVTAQRSAQLTFYFLELQNRLRRVRVCSGDWSRVVGPSVTFGNGLTAVFLDPPYAHDLRDTSLYAVDSHSIDKQAREWAIANGNHPQLRIAYCGYEDGFKWPEGWTAYRWKASGGYANQGEDRGRENAWRETIWFSPHCIKPIEYPLFPGWTGDDASSD